MTARQITTPAELDALAVGSVVVEGDHTSPDEGAFLGITTIPGVFHRFPDGWYVVAGYGPRDVPLPATVLHDPSAETASCCDVVCNGKATPGCAMHTPEPDDRDDESRAFADVMRRRTAERANRDEEAVGSLRALAAQWDAQSAHNADQGGDFWKGMVVKGRECADDLRRSLAVVREHLPVKPDREAVRLAQHRALMPQGMSIFAAVGGAQAAYDALLDTLADAVLALWPGRSEAEVEAEALREAAGSLASSPRLIEDFRADRWLNTRADRIERGES